MIISIFIRGAIIVTAAAGGDGGTVITTASTAGTADATTEDIASLIGTSRPTLNIIMNELKEARIIDFNRKEIRFLSEIQVWKLQKITVYLKADSNSYF